MFCLFGSQTNKRGIGYHQAATTTMNPMVVKFSITFKLTLRRRVNVVRGTRVSHNKKKWDRENLLSERNKNQCQPTNTCVFTNVRGTTPCAESYNQRNKGLSRWTLARKKL